MGTTDYRWDDLQVFLALWHAGSLASAAEALKVNPSTVGRRIDALEEALRVQLFERTPEGVIATLAAEELVPYAEATMRSHEAFALARQGLEQEPEGVVTVTGPPGLIDYFVAPAIGTLCETFPKLRIELDASVGYADLARGDADIALRAQRPTRGDLVSTNLGPFKSAVVGSEAQFGAAAPVSRLDSLRWIQWGEALAHIPDARWVAEHIDDEAIAMRTCSFTSIMEAVRAGVGVTMVAAPFALVPGFCEVPLSGAARRTLRQTPPQDLFLVGHQALRRVPRVAVVWSFLKAHIRVLESR